MKLREIAFARSGDKGDISNICVFPYDDANFALLKAKLTPEAVKEKFGELVKGKIVRYELPGTSGLNFVMHQALAGGVSITLRTDLHGKAFASLILEMEL